jgi:hypothetical protein
MAVSIQDRLAELYRRLAESPPARTAKEALDLICRTLEAVEDELSGFPRRDPPPDMASARGGRMYRPLADNLTRLPDHGIIAYTRRHVILIGSNGSISIMHQLTGIIEFTKKGVEDA